MDPRVNPAGGDCDWAIVWSGSRAGADYCGAVAAPAVAVLAVALPVTLAIVSSAFCMARLTSAMSRFSSFSAA
jgi:hypothetical protein